MDAPTACHLLGTPGAPVVVEGDVVGRDRLGVAARSFARGVAEQGYPPESCFLVTLRDPLRAVEVALGAWWAGMAVCTPTGPPGTVLTGLERDHTAFAIGAALQVCDADEIVDEEHIRHRDIPAVSPAELAMAPARWAPRCTPSTTAVVALDGTGLDAVPAVAESHAGLLDRLRTAAERPAAVVTGPAGAVAVPAATAAVAAPDGDAAPLPPALAGTLLALAGAPGEA